MNGTSVRLPAFAVAFAAVMWGLWWIPVRWLAEGGLYGDWASLALFGVTSALIAPLAFARRRQLAAGGVDLILSGALFGTMMVLWNHAVLIGEVVRVVLLFYLAPVWATLLAATVLRERIGIWRILAVVLGLAGAAVVLGFDAGWPVPRGPADWLGLVSGLFFALSATLARRAEAVSGLDKTLVSYLTAAAVALVLVLADPRPAPSGAIVIAAMPLAIATSVLFILPATWLVFWGAARLDPGRVAILLLLELIAAALAAAILTQEPFGLREAAGCVLILLAGLAEAVPDLRHAARRPRATPSP
jgi:drug/metabolite transporter (DMT)-like permease